MKNTNKGNGNYLVPLIIIGVLFYIIGFGVGISGFLTPFLRDALHLTTANSYLVTAAIFSAFVIFGSPAGWLIHKIGYKKSMFLSLLIMALFVPSAKYESFPVFLIALFVGGIGNTLLQASVNPYVTIVGPIESAAMRMCFMGIMNKLAWWLGPLFLGLFMNLKQVSLTQVILPFYIVTGILVAMSIFIYFSKLPEVAAKGENESAANNDSMLKVISKYPHLLLGTIALFLYVGVETLPMVSIIGYAKVVFGENLTNPAGYAMYVPIGMFVGYLVGVFSIPKLISQTRALWIFASIGIIASLCLIFLPGNTGIFCFSVIGFSNSVMWGAIWPLSIADLGPHTKKGASLLVMSIVGGAIIPFLFGMILDLTKTGEILTISNYQTAYIILIPAYLYILYFALSGYKTRKK